MESQMTQQALRPFRPSRSSLYLPGTTIIQVSVVAARTASIGRLRSEMPRTLTTCFSIARTSIARTTTASTSGTPCVAYLASLLDCPTIHLNLSQSPITLVLAFSSFLVLRWKHQPFLGGVLAAHPYVRAQCNKLGYFYQHKE